MLKAGDRIFAQPADAGDGDLHPGHVVEVHADSWTVDLLPCFSTAQGEDVLLFYDDMRMFAQRRVRVVRSRPSDTVCRLEVVPVGEAVCAERRSVARIATEGMELFASLNGSDFGSVLEISSRGFAVTGNLPIEEGDRVEAVLLHGRDNLGGSVAVRDVQELADGQRRYGVVCVDGLLKFALATVNLAVQRDQLQRLRSGRHADRSRWSLPPRLEVASGRGADGARPHASQPSIRRIRLTFPSLLSFEQQLQRSIESGGMFLPTQERLAPGDSLEVELDLGFCAHHIVLEARVARVRPPGAHGEPAGLEVTFVESSGALRNLLAEISAIDAGSERPSWPRRTARDRHERTSLRIAAIVGYAGKSRPAHTRNLSRSGALLVAEGDAIAIGEPILLTLVDPRRGESVQMRARVVRQVEKEGRVTSMGVRFETDPNCDSAVTRFLDRMQQASSPRMMGRIGGTLAPLGLPNLLQMLTVCVEQGSITLHSGEASAEIGFERGALRACITGQVRGLKALARILEWEDGEFEFRPTLPFEAQDGVHVPMENALLECTHQVDELHRLKTYPLPPGAWFERVPGAPDGQGEVEKEILARIDTGARVQEILDHFPVYDSEIYRTLDALLERGVVTLCT